MTVVVMDSDEVSRRLLRRILAQQRIIDVHEASDGAHGLALIERHDPDLVVLEEALPLVSGLECLQALRASERNRKTAVIVTSLSNTEAVVREFIACGIDDFIVKPLRPRLLQDRIARTIAHLHADTNVVPANNAPTLELGSPVLLIDGSAEYREFFATQAGYFFKVVSAPSGAEGLAIAMDVLPRGIFFGEETGLLDEQRFVAKVRAARELKNVVLYKVTSPDKATSVPDDMDGLLVRSFAPDFLRGELSRLLKPQLMVEALLGPSTETTLAFVRAAVQSLEFSGLRVQARVTDALDVVAEPEDLIAARLELHGASVGVDLMARTTHMSGRGFAAALLGRPEGVVGKVEVFEALTHVVKAAAGRLHGAFAERGLSLVQGDCREGHALDHVDRRLLGVQLVAGDSRMSLEVHLLGLDAPVLAKAASVGDSRPTEARARVRTAVQLPVRGMHHTSRSMTS
jgi:CheY-like chemotaxis protein